VDIVEANAESIEAGRRAARDGKVEGAIFTRGHVGPFLKKGAAAGRRAKVVVANPPRSGMGKSVPESIAAWHATRVVVISCDPATLARDAARLETAGYVLESVIPLDLFPQTAHVECVATFVRR
jgi:23S rRNA (uracil1939-C5)-methyltransferase